MDNRRNFPRIIVLSLGLRFRASNGDEYEVVNASEGGLCLLRHGGVKIATGVPVKGHLSWPEKHIERDIAGRFVWSRLYEDGDAFYGVGADVDWLMEAVGPYKPEDVEPEPDQEEPGPSSGVRTGGPKA